jgi:benzoyl-CoA reductase/2-hydroxyglutaryl-CoA dehydratase subunit BcrC/BadD/HgdB
VQADLSIPRRSAVAEEYKAKCGRVAAVLPVHYPRALLRAFDILPMEVWGPPQQESDRGAAHMQGYFCSVVRNALSFLQAGGLECCDIILVPHTCDSLQGLGSILLDFIQPRQPILPLYIPRGGGNLEIDFFTNELAALSARLHEITGSSPSDDEMLASIAREEEADALLARLHAERLRFSLSDAQHYRLLRAREYLPAEAFSALALAALEQPSAEPPPGIPVLLSGIVPEPMSIFEAFSKSGGLVAADDLASCGRRLYPPGRSNRPLQRMAESLLSGPPDSTRGSSVQARLEHLLALARASSARGVVFYGVKFCEPELFYLPQLKRDLQAAGLPSTAIEIDINEPLSHRTITRLEAFLEMLA